MDPKIVGTILQDDMVYLLRKILKNQESTIPTGLIDDDTIMVTTVRQEYALNYPWHSFTLTNDGVGDVTVWINKSKNIGRVIKANETYNVDMKSPKINKLIFRGSADAIIRISGVR